jgi:hypothetical protein
MLGQRRFRVVIVRPGKGIGMGHTRRPDRVIRYDGQETVATF